MRESNAQLVMRVLECEHHLPTGKQSRHTQCYLNVHKSSDTRKQSERTLTTDSLLVVCRCDVTM